MAIRFIGIALVASMVMAGGGMVSTSEAGWKGKGKYSKYRAKRHRRSRGRRARVRGFIARRGGYSYTTGDVINTYGDSRTRYGGVNAYRDPLTDRQTNVGPFDHGFFFDSAVAPRGGDSPYMQ